jgi:hypothetical protein
VQLSNAEIEVIYALNSRRSLEPEWNAALLAIKYGILELTHIGELKHSKKRAAAEEKLRSLGFSIPWVTYRKDVIDELKRQAIKTLRKQVRRELKQRIR